MSVEIEKPMQSNIIIYQNKEGSIKIDVRLEDETVWLTQQQMVNLYQSSKANVSEHIKHIYEEGELLKEATVRKFRTVQKEGNREVSRELEYYNLDMIISLGYRIKSQIATQFRIWATNTLKEYIIKGFALNDERFKTGNSMNYFSELQERIRAIRISEKFFYQKIKDIYTTSIDYDPKDEKTILFFKIVQNKLLWAISQQTAAELIYRRIDASFPLLGMTSYDKDNELITQNEAAIAKNYLNEDEMKLLGLIVEQYLAFAETMAQQQIPMYMKDWIARLDIILQLNGRELLHHAGKISQKMAQDKVALEYKKYKETQKQIERENSFEELENDIKKLRK